MLPSPVTDIKAFVPAKDPDLSKAFYPDLGFTINWSNDEIAEQQIGGPERPGCGRLVRVHPAHRVAQTYPGRLCQPPAMQPWGLRYFT
jgi:hypothetical protein